MGDGSVIKQHSNPRFQVSVIKKKYLEYLDTQLKNISLGVKIKRKASEQADSVGRRKDNFNDIYTLDTVTHPELEVFRGWYESGEKVWPEKIHLSPVVLKHWYCCDGTLVKEGEYKAPEIAAVNETNNRQKVHSMFDKIDINILDRPNGFRVSAKDSERFFRYIGEPLPGFDYKWPEVYRHC